MDAYLCKYVNISLSGKKIQHYKLYSSDWVYPVPERALEFSSLGARNFTCSICVCVFVVVAVFYLWLLFGFDFVLLFLFIAFPEI